jgi:hypothetical protein
MKTNVGANSETSRNSTYVKDALAVTLLYVLTDLGQKRRAFWSFDDPARLESAMPPSFFWDPYGSLSDGRQGYY